MAEAIGIADDACHAPIATSHAGATALTSELEQMSKLVRYPAPRPIGQTRTRVVVVRQPVRAVGRAAEGDRLPLRLALGVIVSVAVLVGVWLLGALGHSLGYAEALRVPELMLDPFAALAGGARMIVNAPATIITAGMTYTLWLMLAFVAMILPAAGLAASRPLVPGGPRQPAIGVVFSHIGAVAACVNALLVVWWSASPARRGIIESLPFRADDMALWLEQWRAACGFDTLAVIASALWVVLLFRLSIPLWLKALATSASLAAAVIALACFATTAGCVAGIQTGRSVCIFDDDPDAIHLMVGSTRQQIATAYVLNEVIVVSLRDRPSIVDVIDSKPLHEFVDRARTAGE